MEYLIKGENVPRAYEEALRTMDMFGVEEDTRLGKVLTLPAPTILTIYNPEQRIIRSPKRDANPFFHVMETVWMLAGQNNVDWLQQFNSNMATFAEKTGVINAAYGFRWRWHWSKDQIDDAIRLLRKDPTTRRAVIAMWCPNNDTLGRADNACNTHIYFRVVPEENTAGALDMLVCNRSNDLIWGMLGANAVHMTYLHEFIATATGFSTGKYRVVSNNLHLYEMHFPLLHDLFNEDPYETNKETHPILCDNESYQIFLGECEEFVSGNMEHLESEWLRNVAKPVYDSYLARKTRVGDGLEQIEECAAQDIRGACIEWISRRSEAATR